MACPHSGRFADLKKWRSRILVDGDGFIVTGVEAQARSITLDDIQEVTFFKRDEWTTDLICCDVVVRTDAGIVTWFLHEELPGWEDLIRLLERLPGFDRTWRNKVAWPAFADNRTLVFRRID